MLPMQLWSMKLIIEVTLKKTEGKTCDAGEVFDVLSELIDGESVYPQGYDHDEESTYEITDVHRVEKTTVAVR